MADVPSGSPWQTSLGQLVVEDHTVCMCQVPQVVVLTPESPTDLVKFDGPVKGIKH